MESRNVAIIGGCGHVGLPLGVSLANAGSQVCLVDLNQEAVDSVNSGRFPFLENNGESELRQAIDNGLRATTNPEEVSNCEIAIFVVGTAVDEHLNPKMSDLISVVEEYSPRLAPGSLLIMRSTLYPGTMEYLNNFLKKARPDFLLAFCPERVAQGFALEEIGNLPQIVSAYSEPAFEKACELFSSVAPSLVRLNPLEAEMAKLMANSWRYVEFAIANQFYMMAEKTGLDFFRIFEAIRYKYPRAQGYKAPGFAAGPCLFKDTMQLSSFFDHQFNLGHAAMLVNEGLASFAVQMAKSHFSDGLLNKKVGILGMTFKANNDDIRESLSFRVKKLLAYAGAEVVWHDPYLSESHELSEVMASDCLILATPHREYRELSFDCPCVDVWGHYRQSNLEVIPTEQTQAHGTLVRS